MKLSVDLQDIKKSALLRIEEECNEILANPNINDESRKLHQQRKQAIRNIIAQA
jgi:phosphoribosylformylglycinamidine (FGAM) synthase PurS component